MDNPNTTEFAIGKAIVDHVNTRGQTDDQPLWDAHWSPDCVSIEGNGERFEGMAAIRKKNEEWMKQHTVHSCEAQGPHCGPDFAAITFEIDLEPNDGSWPRTTMKEIGLYKIAGGKVVEERFLFPPMH